MPTRSIRNAPGWSAERQFHLWLRVAAEAVFVPVDLTGLCPSFKGV